MIFITPASKAEYGSWTDGCVMNQSEKEFMVDSRVKGTEDCLALVQSLQRY